MKKIIILIIIVLFTVKAFAFNFDFDGLLGLGNKQASTYVDLQSGMLWVNYTPTPQAYVFGSHSTATNTDKVFTLSNPGNDVLEAANLAVAGTGFSLQSTTCGSNPFDLALLTTCTATVRFSPVAGTSYSGTLTASAPNLTSQLINLSGTGVVPPVAPSTPVISVTPGDTTNQIALTSGGTGSPTPSYDVKWGTVAGTRSNTISSVALPYTHTGRTNGTPYYYSLVATNSGGSAESSEVSGTPSVGAISFSDNFNRANANPIGSPWVTITGLVNLRIVSNDVVGDGANDSGAYYNNAIGANQYSAIVYDSVQNYSGPLVRVSSSAKTYYKLEYGSSTVYLIKKVAGAGTVLNSWGSQSVVTGDELKITAVGTTISAYKNGVLIGSVTDNAISSGYAGILMVYGSVTSWTGGEL